MSVHCVSYQVTNLHLFQPRLYIFIFVVIIYEWYLFRLLCQGLGVARVYCMSGRSERIHCDKQYRFFNAMHCLHGFFQYECCKRFTWNAIGSLNNYNTIESLFFTHLNTFLILFFVLTPTKGGNDRLRSKHFQHSGW